MRSLADSAQRGGRRVRGAIELALRSLAVLAVLALLVLEFMDSDSAQRSIATAEGAESALPAIAAAVRDPRVHDVHLELATAPDASTRDLIRAVRRSGVGVTWNAPLPPAGLLSVEPLASPGQSQRLTVASEVPLILADDAGILDSVPAGASVILGAHVSGSLRAWAASDSARALATAMVRDSLHVRRVLVLGMAGWESRFVTVALEEAGWNVDARLGVSPTATVAQGVIRPDTARHSAVVVLDSSAAPYSNAIADYARSGGGVILLPDALSLRALRSVAPGGRGGLMSAEDGMLASPEPRHGLPMVPIVGVRDDSFILEDRDGAAAVAIRRTGAGRVLQTGYQESWRWRLAGGEGAPVAHRAWWSSLVQSVAYAPSSGSAVSQPWTHADETPVAALLATIGPPDESAPLQEADTIESRGIFRWWLFGIAILALLAEWASRRFRGLA
ncbi:MAG TPA: hypothetical protein VKZ41_01675 [Gemmatimonadales bacterium]|nr:hypothetical protein [Gemmatimonadales bacterium]